MNGLGFITLLALAYNGTIEWLKGGCIESVEEMTQSLGEFMNIEREINITEQALGDFNLRTACSFA